VNLFFSEVEKTVLKVPEKQLLAAIILRTWADLDSLDRNLRNTSYYWLDLKETCDWSFPWICEHLGFNPKQLRRAMLTSPFYEAIQKVSAERYGKDKKSWLCFFD
jgi:hypothetical protein